MRSAGLRHSDHAGRGLHVRSVRDRDYPRLAASGHGYQNLTRAIADDRRLCAEVPTLTAENDDPIRLELSRPRALTVAGVLGAVGSSAPALGWPSRFATGGLCA